MPTKLTLDPTTATLIGNHQIMVVPIGGTDKLNNNGIPLVSQYYPTGPQKSLIHGSELTITRNVEPMHTSSNDSSVTIVETSDSDMNGKQVYFNAYTDFKNLTSQSINDFVIFVDQMLFIYFHF